MWLYHDDDLDSRVAVKALADNWAQRADVRERFLDEARMLRRADSEHVVRVYDIGEVDQTPYFVMSYADLGSLAASGTSLPRIHLLIDNLPALIDAIERGGAARRGHVDLLLQVLQEGRRCGVHVSATTPQRVGLPAAMMACFAQRLVLRMTVDDDYAMLGAPVGVVDRDSAPGRGLHGGRGGPRPGR